MAAQQSGFKRVKRGYKPLKVETLVGPIKPGQDPTDPYFNFQWYLKNTGQNGGKPKLDLNVEAAWAQGVTGKNVTTAIMDDGVDYMHPDLKFNYVSVACRLEESSFMGSDGGFYGNTSLLSTPAEREGEL